jgi:hypothetical protein
VEGVSLGEMVARVVITLKALSERAGGMLPPFTPNRRNHSPGSRLEPQLLLFAGADDTDSH